MELKKNELIIHQQEKARSYYWFGIAIALAAMVGAIYFTNVWPQTMPSIMLNERTTVLMKIASMIFLVSFPTAAIIFWLESRGTFVLTNKRIIILGKKPADTRELSLAQVDKIELTTSLVELVTGCRSLSVFLKHDDDPPVQIGPFSRQDAEHFYSIIMKHVS
ncbi:MAG: hypothetical protein HPY81_03235 [Firmicutes bacterium]|nr:hypothetical protein [Bacillota bacterium]